MPDSVERDWGPYYRAFLDQARWLLGEQQRRSSNFVAGAVAVLGFDGVVLALLASSDVLMTATPTALWAARAGAVLVTTSALATLGAMWPRSVASADWEEAVRAWSDFHDKTAADGGDPQQRFAQMILTNPASTPAPPVRSVWSWRVRAGQPLKAAFDEATQRGKWFLVAVFALACGVAALLTVVLAETFG